MSLWGGVIGGLVGFTMLGPLGALVGGVIGSKISGNTSFTRRKPNNLDKQVAFFAALFACLGTGIVGVGIGGTLPVRPSLLADYFGTKHIGSITGLSNGLATFGSAISPIFIGWMFDSTGSYELAWLICMVSTFVAVPLFWFSKDPQIVFD